MKYMCWIIGRRDETACKIEAPATEIEQEAARVLGVPANQVAIKRLEITPRYLSQDRQKMAYADFEKTWSIVSITLWRYRTKVKGSQGRKKVVTHYKWINDDNERQGAAWESLGEAVAYAVRHKAFMNIRLWEGNTQAEQITVRMMARKYSLQILSA